MAKAWMVVLVLPLGPLVCGANEPDARAAWLVTFGELEGRLGEANLRVLDARPKKNYDAGHIPGAVWVDVKEAAKMAARPGGLNDRATWERWISPLGIGPKTEVVVYDANRQLDAARLWWLLSYLGVKKVGLMNGHFPLWAAEKRAITTEVPTVQLKPFKVAFRAGRHATRNEVLSALAAKSDRILDARTVGEYQGTDRRAKRAGHVPAACHLEWNQLVDQDGRFLNESALRAKLAKAGVKENEPVITHCQSGGRASVNAFVLERLGFKARNYYLGWSDWGNAEETPVKVEETSKPRK